LFENLLPILPAFRGAAAVAKLSPVLIGRDIHSPSADGAKTLNMELEPNRKLYGWTGTKFTNSRSLGKGV
jgi:hypothetical protein